MNQPTEMYTGLVLLQPSQNERTIAEGIHRAIGELTQLTGMHVRIIVKAESLEGAIQEVFPVNEGEPDDDEQFEFPADMTGADPEMQRYAGCKLWMIHVEASTDAEVVPDAETLRRAMEEIRFWVFQNGIELEEDLLEEDTRHRLDDSDLFDEDFDGDFGESW